LRRRAPQVEQWSAQDTAQFLRSIELPALAPVFLRNAISGAVLASLTHAEFAELVPNKFHRRAPQPRCPKRSPEK